MAQFGRALRSGRRGRRFESCRLDQFLTRSLWNGSIFYRKDKNLRRFEVSPAGSVGAFASQRCPPDTRTLSSRPPSLEIKRFQGFFFVYCVPNFDTEIEQHRHRAISVAVFINMLVFILSFFTPYGHKP